jgi:phospholipid-binding lipoprotein MlaA
MNKTLRAFVSVLLAMAFTQGAAATETPPGWLERGNRALHDFNLEARAQFAALAGQLPSLGNPSPGLRNSAANLVSTWVAEPWQAFALALAGRPADSRIVLDRVATNITQGQGGLRDLATERGMPAAPRADIGLALCARGVPEGPYVVLPVLGGRTLRDGLADFVVANALVYSAMLPFTGPSPPIEVFIAVELLETIPTLALAESMGRSDGSALPQMGFEAARDSYLASRRAACDRLRAP